MKQIICVISMAVTAACFSWQLNAQDWMQFRGPGASNVDSAAQIPVELGDNIAWKVELPGKGPAGPIVVGDRVFVSSSAGVGQDQLFVTCYDINNGDKIWEQEFWATGRCFCHSLSANAAPTPKIKT